MNHSIVTFRGRAALPGIFLCLTRVNRGHSHFFNLSHTGHMKAGTAYSPLNSISYHLASEMRDYPIKEGILAKGWRIEHCAFRMWIIGPSDTHTACSGLSFHDGCIIALMLAVMIRKHLKENGHDTTGFEFEITKSTENKHLIEIALMLFEEYLRDIFPSLLEDMDLDSHNFDLDK